ncbi:hypothetical protein chiPu_0012733 [Chiloscyllium punctatum]|uniref:Uncharacterized protein n=1 Tax=Chiloscyllium punctatum TaxID=137246 RepID=A0A401SV48_CHIPU|nr:hypothetical protein [Chiloscyllium punctatum]
MTRTLSAVTFLSPGCPPPISPSSPLEELWEFVEETLSRRDRAQLALDRWSSFDSVYWLAHAACQAPGLDANERKRVRNFLGALLGEGEGLLCPSPILPVNVYIGF